MNRVVFPRRIVGPVPRARVQIACAPAPHLRRAGTRPPFASHAIRFPMISLATIDCLNAMGAKITHAGGTISVSPIFANGRPDGACQLYCKESGSTLRFLLPVVGALGLDAVFHMEGRLPERPLHPFDEVLIAHGMHIHQTGAELHVSGKLLAGSFALPGNVSSQYLSGLLFALPLLPGSSTLTITGALQSASYLAMTEDAVLNSGIRFSKSQNVFSIPGNQTCCLPDGLAAEGDWSGAAFFSLRRCTVGNRHFCLRLAGNFPPGRPGRSGASVKIRCGGSGGNWRCLSESPRFTASALTRRNPGLNPRHRGCRSLRGWRNEYHERGKAAAQGVRPAAYGC